MKRNGFLSGWILAGLALLPVVAGAQIGVGARAMSMGGAFTALAEGDGAILWNPAAAANRRAYRFLMPSLALMLQGPGSATEALRGLPSGWDDRIRMARRWTTGVTNVTGSAYAGFATPGATGSVFVFGKGRIVPTDGDGTVGKMTITPNFTLDSLREATIREYQIAGVSQSAAERDAGKIINYLKGAYPGATKLALPLYQSRIEAKGDIYGAFLVTMARTVSPTMKVGVNLKLVSARRLTGYARFNGSTFTEKAAEVTGNTASPAMVNRILARMNLRQEDGSFFAGGQLPGEMAEDVVSSGLEIRPSADVGALWQIKPRWQVGMTINNLLPAHFRAAAPLNTHANVGAAYVAVPGRLLVAADLTNLMDSSGVRLNVGAEWRPQSTWAVRLGMYRGRPTFGLGFRGGISVALSPDTSLLSIGTGF